MAAEEAFDLQRFVAAQQAVYAQVLDELTAGRKRSHWMWFVFPQLRGLTALPRNFTASHRLTRRRRICGTLSSALDWWNAQSVSPRSPGGALT